MVTQILHGDVKKGKSETEVSKSRKRRSLKRKKINSEQNHYEEISSGCTWRQKREVYVSKTFPMALGKTADWLQD